MLPWLASVAAGRVELHVHLDGSVAPETLFEAAVRRNLSLPGVGVPKSVADIWTVLHSAQSWHRFDVVNDIIGGDVTALHDVAVAFVAGQAAAQVEYTEVRYDPVRAAFSHYANVSISQEAAVAAVSAGLRAGSETHGVRVYSLLCAMRGQPASACVAVAELAAKLRSTTLGGVVGLDLAGDELSFNNTLPIDYVSCFQHAKNTLGLNTTVHAGEVPHRLGNSTDDVRTAIEDMRVDRIGHGYAGVASPSVLTLMKRSGVHLEACPASASSKYGYGIAAIGSYREQGINFGLNRDDPSAEFANCTMNSIEAMVISKLGFVASDLELAYSNALAAAFGPTGPQE